MAESQAKTISEKQARPELRDKKLPGMLIRIGQWSIWVGEKSLWIEEQNHCIHLCIRPELLSKVGGRTALISHWEWEDNTCKGNII